MREEVEIWWNQAEKDLRASRNSLKSGDYGWASFQSQQAAEKSLKALLIKQTKEFPKIHDLVRLGKLVGIDKELLKDCERLTLVYTGTRYPNGSGEKYTKEETEEDINSAEKILKWIKKLL